MHRLTIALKWTISGVAAVMNITTSLIKRRFPSTLVLPVFGNHDNEPDNYFADTSSQIYAKTFELWKDWIGNEAKVSF